MTELTAAEFVGIAVMDDPTFFRLMHGRSVQAAMSLRRQLQMGLAKHSKGKQGKVDTVAGVILQRCAQIESWCKQRFAIEAKKRLIPKGQARAEWEEVVKKWSY